jgi:O-antigen/teichoic acid export membrane protein
VAILPIAEAVSASILLRRFRTLVHFDLGSTNLAATYKLLAQAFPIAGTIIIVTLYTRLDVIALSSFVDSASVGYYGVAFRLTEPVQLVAASFAMSVYSHLAATHVREHTHTRQLIMRYGGFILGYGALCCIVLALIAPVLIEWLLPQYTPAITVLRILAVALIFRTLNSCLTSTIQAYGYFSAVTRIALVNLFVICGLLWTLVPQFGAPGAAGALLCGEVVNTIIQGMLVKQIVANQPQILSSQEAS